MADEDRKFRLSADVLGGVLFTLSSFPMVLVVMTLFRDPGSGGAATAARWVVGGLGHAAPILWAGGFAVVGILMVLGKEDLPVLRTLGGIAGTALGLSILLGGVTPDGGGSFGSATGGAVAARLTEPVAIFFGVVCVLAPIWFGFVRGMISEFSVREEAGAAVLPEDTDGGVSSEEAALLVPTESSLEYLEEAWREVREAERPPTLAPSPYPEDPRLAGDVPEGTVPIERKDGQDRGNRPPAAPTSHWKRSKGEVGAGVAAGADLAADEDAAVGAAGEPPAGSGAAPSREPRRERAEPAAAAADLSELGDPVEAIEERLKALEPVPAVEPMPEIQPVQPRAHRAPAASEEAAGAAAEAGPEATAETAPSEPQAVAPAVLEPQAPAPVEAGDVLSVEPVVEPVLEPGVAPVEALPIQPTGPPVPSWEQSDLFEDEQVEDALAEPEEPSVEEYAEEPEVDVEEDPAEAGSDDSEEALAEVDEEAEEEVDEDEVDEDEELEDEDEEYEEGELEDEEYEDEDEDEELEDEELEDDEEYEDEELEDEELEDDEEYEDEDEEEYEDDEEAEEDEDEAAELEEEGESDEEEEDEEEEDESSAELPDEAPEEAEAADEPAEGAAEQATEEPEVVLQPQAAPAEAKIPSQPSVAAAAGELDAQMLYNAGVHFLEEGRVAVSMLQRKFGVDFDQACELLDALQERGLIGPYLGGQRRDILMSLEEWEETVTST